MNTSYDRRERLPWRRVLPLVASGLTLAIFLLPAVAPASVEEQRRRLPPPAKDCDDPVTGLWQGHELLNGRWYKFRLEIDREEPGSQKLVGNVESHSWEGGPEQSTPPPCEAFSDQFILDMPADGSFDGKRIEFIGRSWKLRKLICGSVGTYYPDGFSGELNEEGTEFQSISDDGVNMAVPVVFRRIACADKARPVPALPDEAPPPRFSSGCGCL